MVTPRSTVFSDDDLDKLAALIAERLTEYHNAAPGPAALRVRQHLIGQSEQIRDRGIRSETIRNGLATAASLIEKLHGADPTLDIGSVTVSDQTITIHVDQSASQRSIARILLTLTSTTMRDPMINVDRPVYRAWPVSVALSSVGIAEMAELTHGERDGR
jgi:hypothetical protein